MIGYRIGETYISNERIYAFITLDEAIYVGKRHGIERKALTFNVTYDLDTEILHIETTAITVDRQIDVIENFTKNIDTEQLKNQLRKIYLKRML